MSDDQARIDRINRVFKRINREILHNCEIGNPWAYIDILAKDWSIVDDLRDRILKEYSHMEMVVEIERTSVPNTATFMTVKWDEFD